MINVGKCNNGQGKRHDTGEKSNTMFLEVQKESPVKRKQVIFKEIISWNFPIYF